MSGAQLMAALRRAGFQDAPRRGKGSHHALVRRDAAGRTRLVIVSDRKDVPRGTLLSILEMAGLSREEFLALLR